MFDNLSISQILNSVAVWALPVLFAITLHEAAHAFAAKYFGDDTAYALGRMSLNPLKHIDWFGTVLLPVLLLLANSPFMFGYAKPVPVNFSRLKNFRVSSALVALAGPSANLLMAIFWQMLKIVFVLSGIKSGIPIKMTDAGIVINLALFAFNLFPIPPLDGGRILTSLLPTSIAWKFARIERFGFFIVLALVYFKMLTYWMRPLMYVGAYIVKLVLLPITLFLR